MTTDHHHYFQELAAALRGAGVPADRADATVADLTGHLAETGADPLAEFGPATEFAARLAGGGPENTGPDEPDEPGAAAESWRWTCDIYNDRRLLGIYGDQGWEVERLDTLGRFVCRRSPGTALRWEYRREPMTLLNRRAVIDRLAPEGWELCGEWILYAYFKRPRAAEAGPAAALTELPAPPPRSLFLSRHGKLVLGLCASLVLLSLVLLAVSGSSGPWWVTAVAGACGGVGALYGVRRDILKGAESR
ncbi:hypothetical protein NX801_13425 [Streptomyces sp. LP05-1]|uniref:DUF2812 domain-containing protein n=1 Tax=Streptomyces pyxinae TaxID=2970734 RepID=A0ABT2CGV4_9ACTN|nr:hypothetical protein [Streptomyces sp. LP05-1]MCS0636641.1 hypothetical protein [Streptomyces sp. LP05-1]